MLISWDLRLSPFDRRDRGMCTYGERKILPRVFDTSFNRRNLEKLPRLSNKNYFCRSNTLEIDLQNLEIINKEYPFLYLWHQNSIEKFTSYLMHKTIIVLRPDRHQSLLLHCHLVNQVQFLLPCKRQLYLRHLKTEHFKMTRRIQRVSS
jgi:hypothetical protein